MHDSIDARLDRSAEHRLFLHLLPFYILAPWLLLSLCLTHRLPSSLTLQLLLSPRFSPLVASRLSFASLQAWGILAICALV